MARRPSTTTARSRKPPRPEIVLTRAARVRLGAEPEPGESRTVHGPGLIADLSDFSRNWTGYPGDQGGRDQIFFEARQLRRRVARASPETLAEVRARASTLRAPAELSFRCVIDFLFTGERGWARADAEVCLAQGAVPPCAELLLASLDDPELATRIVDARFRVDLNREVCRRALELVHGLGTRAVPVLAHMFAILDADRRADPVKTTRGASAAMRAAHAQKHSALMIPRVLEAMAAIRTADAAAFFASRLGTTETRAMAGRYFRAEPELALRVLPPVAARRNKAAALARALLDVVNAEHPHLADAAPPARRSVRPRPSSAPPREATPAELPPVLADPPWRREDPRHTPHCAVHLLETPIPVNPAVHSHDEWVKRLPHVPAFLVFSPRIAGAMASSWLHRVGRRKVAEAWLLAFPEIAAVGLLPRAVGSEYGQRADALRVLRFLMAEDEEAVRRGIARYSADAQRTLAASLAHDPIDECPEEPPGRPRFLRVEALPRPLLAGREVALPLFAVRNLVEMLIFAVDGFPYAGIAQVKAACDQASLDAFVWAIYEAWLAAGASSRVRWPLRALGELGGDEIAKRLLPLIRAWPSQRAVTRAVAGVRALGRIGTDIALTHLGSVAELSHSRRVRREAREVLHDVADARGLTPQELADRTVPDLDLGPDDGSPSPWEGLKGDAQAIVSAQILRLERMTAGVRAWSVPTFRSAVLGHRLMVRLVRGLVLGAVHEGGRAAAFRVTENGSFLDVDEAPVDIDAARHVAILHPLHLGSSARVAWGSLFADYELLQPFPQLGRDVYVLTEEERASTSLARFAGTKLPARRVLDLEALGWEHVGPDRWTIEVFWKRLPGDRYVRFDLQPGISMNHLRSPQEQTVGPLRLIHGKDDAAFGGVDPVLISELLRELAEAFQA